MNRNVFQIFGAVTIAAALIALPGCGAAPAPEPVAEHHEGDGHDHGEHGHSHGEEGHSHGEEGHDHHEHDHDHAAEAHPHLK